MATIASALNTEFTPATGKFAVQASGGAAELMRRQSAGAAFVRVGLLHNEGADVSNDTPGAVYKFVAVIGTPVVQADQ